MTYKNDIRLNLLILVACAVGVFCFCNYLATENYEDTGTGQWLVQQESPPVDYDKIPRLLKAIAIVECGKAGNFKVIGDGGRSYGPLQISKPYWVDANMAEGGWFDCWRYDYACRVVIQYWHRYARRAFYDEDLETLARLHNGGPNGARLDSTLHYWDKVKREYDKLKGN